MQESGAQEFLANLSIGMIVTIAALLTVVRLALLRPTIPAQGGRPAQVPDGARSFAEIIESLIVAGVLVFLIIRPFFLQAFFIPSESMEPTLLGHIEGDSQTGKRHTNSVNDHIFVNKLAYRIGDPKRGDIVVFKAPKHADAEGENRGNAQENVLIKRVVAVPGDTIEVRGEGEASVLYLNGKRLDETTCNKNADQQTVGPCQGTPKTGYYIMEPMDGYQPPNAKYAVNGEPLKLKPGEYFVMGDNRNDSNDSRFWGPLTRDRVIGKASLVFLPLNRIGLLR